MHNMLLSVFIMATILPFAFEVVHKCFLGQARMHVCVHLYTCACTCVHGYRYGSRYVHVLLMVLAWGPFNFLPFCCFSISSIRFLYWISVEGGSNQIFNLVGLPHS